jgi:elongator complex protein 1
MSSYQLAVPPDLSLTSPIPAHSTPVYVVFSPENDTLGVLWEHGYLEIWVLKTRLLPGPGKIMDPSKLWAGIIHENKDTRWRQVAVRLNSPDSYAVMILGTVPGAATDSIAILTVKAGTTDSSSEFQLPSRNCRLLTGSVVDTYQGADGSIFHCESCFYHCFY